jgi:siroheme synthase-like protein
MSTHYPVLLKLEAKRCVVIGGGWGTEKRVNDLLDAGALVTLISRVASPEIETIVERGRIRWEARDYRPGDLEGAFLVVACPRDHSRNSEIWAEAEARGIPVNAIDDAPHCTFIFPAVHRQGDLVVAVSTAGKSPALAASIRDRIASEFGPEYGEFLNLLGKLRPEVIRRFHGFKQRRPIWRRLIRSEALDHIKAGRPEAARIALQTVLEGETRS